MDPTLARLRAEYKDRPLDESTLEADPLALFTRWMDEALAAGLREANAMTLATADASGRPHARIVLLKGMSDGRFVFYTNLGSAKARELEARPHAALVFHWGELERQVRIEGTTARVTDAEADAYFATRPRESQIGAWASAQSEPIAGREVLLAAVAQIEARFADKPVTRPPFWGGLYVAPERYEFWQGRVGRLHDRIAYDKSGAGFTRRRLSP